jgi:general secretion pathway protein A
MYEQHFGFREPPFRITPDPRFLYRNPAVEEAAAALAYGIERRKGFLSLVGEAGTGKTTLLRHVLDTLSGNVRTVLLMHPTVEFDEILEYVLTELGIPIDGGRKLVQLQRLHEFLLEHTRAGGNVALIVDEAQDLAPLVLEELRLLSNLETGTEKILQIVLAGQPELEKKLGDPALRQLRQRIALHVRLRPLSPEEVAAYISCRVAFAGANRTDIFAPDAVTRIATVSQGIPRVINVLADACLVTAYATGMTSVTLEIVDEAWADYARLAFADVPAAFATPAPIALVPAPPSTLRADERSPAPTPAPEPPATVARALAALAPEPPRPGPAPTPILVDEPPAPTEQPLDALAAPEWPSRTSARTAIVVIVVVLVTLAGFHLLPGLPGRAAVQQTASTPTAPALTPTVPMARQPTEPAATTAPAPRAGDVPSAAEARAVVHQFILAYEARDVARLLALFSPEATSNEHQGVDAIRADYQRTFARVEDPTVTVPEIDLASWGDRMVVSGPMVISYRERGGAPGEQRGKAEWEIMRRGGTPRIVALRYESVNNPS